jgi:hypothetical protein
MITSGSSELQNQQKSLDRSNTMMPRRNGDELAPLAEQEMMSVLLRGEMHSAPGGAPKWLVDVSITTWCGKKCSIVDEPYHAMPNDSVWAYLKDRMKKDDDDGLNIWFVTIKFERASPPNIM